jgi:hypothetical protein
VSLPPERLSMVAACFASRAVFVRTGAMRMSVTSRIRSVTAAAAASEMSDS